MNLYSLDASAWVKRYYREVGSEWVRALFHQETLLASSSLGLIEVLATRSRKAKAGEIDRNEATIRQLAAVSDWNGFLEIRLNAEVTERAKDVTMRLSLRGADAIHLASALTLQAHRSASTDHMIFVSSDTELNEALALMDSK